MKSRLRFTFMTVMPAAARITPSQIRQSPAQQKGAPRRHPLSVRV